ncbi:MAG TPA: hypothetical protein VMX12_00120 [Acidimicrobiia bacterium]|nr:hypothetical protein [Acidimicrobiia bacterium]
MTAWAPTVNSYVKYYDAAAAKPQHARVTAVTDATAGAEVISLAYGATTQTGVLRATVHADSSGRWWHGRNPA